MVRADQSACEEELTAVSGAGPELSSLVSVLWSWCPLGSRAPVLLSLCIRSGALLPTYCTAHTSSLLCWLPAPSPGYTLPLSLCQPSLPTVSLVRDKLLLQRDGSQARQILHSVQRKKWYVCCSLSSIFGFGKVFSKIQFSNLPISQLTMLWVFVCWLTSFPMTTGQRLRTLWQGEMCLPGLRSLWGHFNGNNNERRQETHRPGAAEEGASPV